MNFWQGEEAEPAGNRNGFWKEMAKMQYWNDLATERSWEVLQQLRKKFKFVLIGGWAVYLWAKTQKSKDIDVIVDFGELQKIREQFTLKKNERLGKFEIIVEGIDVDIYVPHYSRLSADISNLKGLAVGLSGFKVAKPELLLALKQGAELDRGESEKGLKDRLDIMALLLGTEIDFGRYLGLVEEGRRERFRRRLIEVVSAFREHNYLGMTPAELKREKRALLEKIKTQAK